MSYRLSTIDTAPVGVSRETSEISAAEPAALSPSEAYTALASIVCRAQAGDLMAQTELVSRYRRRVTGLVRGIVPVRCMVEDLVQTTMIKMIRRLPQLRNPAVFESWMMSLARNGALDYLRRRKCQPMTVFDEVALLTVPETLPERTEEEIFAALDRALEQLNPRDRRLVRQVVRGESYRAIAAREGVSVAMVKIRLHRVRPFLRASVGGDIGVESRSPRSTRPPE